MTTVIVTQEGIITDEKGTPFEDQTAVRVVIEHRNMTYPFTREPVLPGHYTIDLPEFEEVEQWKMIDGAWYDKSELKLVNDHDPVNRTVLRFKQEPTREETQEDKFTDRDLQTAFCFGLLTMKGLTVDRLSEVLNDPENKWDKVRSQIIKLSQEQIRK